VFASRCKISSRTAASEQDFDRWQEEIEALFKRLSIVGGVKFLDNDDDFVDRDSDYVYEVI